MVSGKQQKNVRCINPAKLSNSVVTNSGNVMIVSEQRKRVFLTYLSLSYSIIVTNHTMLNLIGRFRYSKSEDKKREISND